MNSETRVRKAVAAYQAAEDAMLDECGRALERFCVELSYRWPKRTIELLSGMGSTNVEISGTVNGKPCTWDFGLPDTIDCLFKNDRGHRNMANDIKLRLPGVETLAFLDECGLHYRGDLWIARHGRTVFRNGQMTRR